MKLPPPLPDRRLRALNLVLVCLAVVSCVRFFLYPHPGSPSFLESSTDDF